MRARSSTKDVIRMKLSTILILLQEERYYLAKAASELVTGALNEEQRKFEQESLLHETMLFDMDAQIIEAMIKTMI